MGKEQFVMAFNWLGSGDYSWGIRQSDGRYKFLHANCKEDNWTKKEIEQEKYVTVIYFDKPQLEGMYRELISEVKSADSSHN